MGYLINPNPEMLVYIGIADAYAAATEYLKLPRDRALREEALRFAGYLRHGTHSHNAGAYTDDTEMSVANAQVLIEHVPPYSPKQFADAYVCEFNRGGRRKGYSRRFQQFLEEVRDGDEFLSRIDPRSDKNGAAMRAVPIGALSTVDDVLDVATLQARITHDTPEGRFSARAIALMSHYALYVGGQISMIAEYCCTFLPHEDDCFKKLILPGKRWPGGPVMSRGGTPVAITTVQAVADLVTHSSSLMGILEQTIRWGGDTDSVAAIAWGIASTHYRHDALPEFMRRDLESGSDRTGTTYLRAVGTRLMAKFA